MRNGLWVALALFLGACFDGEDLTEGLPCVQNSNCGGSQLCINGFCGGEEIQQGGDPCEVGGNVCVDGNTLGVCNLSDMSTMEVSCDASCEGSGFSTSLGCRSSTGSKHQCYCDQASAQCTETLCSGNVLLECNGGDIDVTDCREMCQASGQTGSCQQDGTTLVFSCVCAPGTCYDGDTFCQDDNTEIRCVGGVWQPQACSDASCHGLQCPSEFSCPEGYQGQTLGCGYDGTNSRSGCRCTT
jgi:hypothetical protein